MSACWLTGRAVPVKRCWLRRFTPPARETASPLSPLTAAHCRSSYWSQSCSGMPKGPLPAQSVPVTVCLKPQVAARCSWMRLAICRNRYRLSCCGCCRSVRSGRWAAIMILRSTCALFQPRIEICRRRWRKRSFARISSIVLMWWIWRFRRCISALKIFRCWLIICCVRRRNGINRRFAVFPLMRWSGWWRPAGRAMCVSWLTWLSSVWRWAHRRSSAMRWWSRR